MKTTISFSPGDGTAPISSGTSDSLAILTDIAASYDDLEQNIDLAFMKLTQNAHADIPAFIQNLKTQTVQARQDSLQSINRRYYIPNH